MSKEGRQISLQDIQSVQDLIEKCLKLYMSQNEVVSTLLDYAKIEPCFTQQVWKSLEAQNEDFFRAYHMRLMVKDQILRFNQLLERQAALERDLNQTGRVSTPMPNGSHIHSMHNSVYQAELSGPYTKTEGMDRMTDAIPNAYANGAQPMQPSMLVNMMSHSGRLDMPPDMLMGPRSSSGMTQGFSGGMIKAEGHYSGDSAIMYAAAANNRLLQQPCNRIGGASISPLNGSESSGRALHESMLNTAMDSFGFSAQMAQNISFSDELMVDFSNSADILQSYSRSPFLGMDANFSGRHIREGQQDITKMDTTSEEFSYKGFGSD